MRRTSLEEPTLAAVSPRAAFEGLRRPKRDAYRAASILGVLVGALGPGCECVVDGLGRCASDADCLAADRCDGRRCVPRSGGDAGPDAGSTGTDGCTPESDAALCAAAAKNCGNVTFVDACGQQRTVDCGTCTPPAQCGQSVPNLCGPCTAETDNAFCARLIKNCGPVTGTDNCGVSRTVTSCGSCIAPMTCGGGGTANVCGCTPETDTAICSRLGKDCGPVTAVDNCGVSRTVTSCGNCSSPQTCGGGGTAGVCGCTPSCPACRTGNPGNGCGGICSSNCGVVCCGDACCGAGEKCGTSGCCTDLGQGSGCGDGCCAACCSNCSCGGSCRTKNAPACGSPSPCGSC